MASFESSYFSVHDSRDVFIIPKNDENDNDGPIQIQDNNNKIQSCYSQFTVPNCNLLQISWLKMYPSRTPSWPGFNQTKMTLNDTRS